MNLIGLYITLVALFVFCATWLALRRLQRGKEQLHESLKNRKEPGAIPGKFRNKKIKEQQIERVESHVSITRRTLIVLFLSAGGCLAAIPYLAEAAPAVLPVVIAAVSVVIGITAKPILENITCGLVLSFGKLARIGDTVLIDQEYGVIEDFTLTHSVIRRWDSLRYVVPNSSMMTKEFINYSLNDNNRWTFVEFWIDYNADLKLAEKIAVEAPLDSNYYSDRDKPRFWVAETGRDAVKCMIVAWAITPADGWMLSHDIRKALVSKLKEHNIVTHTHRIHINKNEPEPVA